MLLLPESMPGPAHRLLLDRALEMSSAMPRRVRVRCALQVFAVRRENSRSVPSASFMATPNIEGRCDQVEVHHLEQDRFRYGHAASPQSTGTYCISNRFSGSAFHARLQPWRDATTPIVRRSASLPSAGATYGAWRRRDGGLLTSEHQPARRCASCAH